MVNKLIPVWFCHELDRKLPQFFTYICKNNKKMNVPLSQKWIDIVKMSILPKLICSCNTIPNKFPIGFFIDMDKLILKFILKGTGIRIAKPICKRRIKWKKSLHPMLRVTT